MARRAPKCSRCREREATPFDRKKLAARLDEVLAHLAETPTDGDGANYFYGYAASALMHARVTCETLCLACAIARREELGAKLFPKL